MFLFRGEWRPFQCNWNEEENKVDPTKADVCFHFITSFVKLAMTKTKWLQSAEHWVNYPSLRKAGGHWVTSIHQSYIRPSIHHSFCISASTHTPTIALTIPEQNQDQRRKSLQLTENWCVSFFDITTQPFQSYWCKMSRETTHPQNSGSHFMILFTKVEQIHTQSSCMCIPWSPSLLPLLYNRSCWHCPLFLLAFQYQVKINYVTKKTLRSILGQHKTNSHTVHWWKAVQK